MGATLPPSKSMTFSTDAATRGWLRTHKWRRVNRTMAVVTDCRGREHTWMRQKEDGMVRRWYGKTLTSRMLQVADETEKAEQNKSTAREESSTAYGKEDAASTVWL